MSSRAGVQRQEHQFLRTAGIGLDQADNKSSTGIPEPKDMVGMVPH